jgi:hypothetical protein
MRLHRFFSLLAMLAISFGSTTSLVAAPLITAFGSNANQTNLGPSGLNLGKLGYWFPNFGVTTGPTGNQVVDQGSKKNLPSWVQVDFNLGSATYSFADDFGRLPPQVAYSRGGIAGSSVLTLPDNTIGLSGQLIDTLGVTNNQSDTIIKSWVFGPGAPSSLLLSIVLDNVPTSALTAVSRLRVTQLDITQSQSAQAEFNGLTANGVSDVYTFRLDGIVPGNYFAVQVRKAQTPVPADAGIGGILFDRDPLAIPEASSVVMVSMASLVIVTFTAFRKRRLVATSN